MTESLGLDQGLEVALKKTSSIAESLEALAEEFPKGTFVRSVLDGYFYPDGIVTAAAYLRGPVTKVLGEFFDERRQKGERHAPR